MLPNFFLNEIDLLSQKFDLMDLTDSNIYQEFLIQTFYYVRHSTKLLALAIARFSWEEDSIRYRFETHISEESHHEKLILMDLKYLGNCESQNWKEHTATKALYQAQYYNVEYLDPICLMGYILFLEGLAVRKGGPLCHHLENKFGPKGTTFLRVHSREDIDHLEQAFKTIDRLNPEKIKLISETFLETIYHYERFLESVQEKFNTPRISLALERL